MPVAVEFFLDEPSADVVRQAWRALAEAGVSAYLHTSGVRPHLTLAVGERMDLDGLAPLLDDFAGQTPPLSVTFADLGVSARDPANLFLVPIVTSDLLELHQHFWEGLVEKTKATGQDRQEMVHQPSPGDPAPSPSSSRPDGLIRSPSERYQPGRWLPHCTLVERVPPDLLPRAIEVCRQTPLPLTARLAEVGVVEWRPVRQLCAFPLGGPRA